MSEQARIFNDRAHQMFAAASAAAQRAERMVPLYTAMLVSHPLLLVGVALLDYELFYRIFDYAVGGNEGYWNSHLMACTGLVMLIAFHIKAAKVAKRPLTRFIERAASWVIAAFAVGGGLYVAVLLFRDGLAAVGIDLPDFGMPDDGPAVDPSEWVDGAFTYLLEPTSVLTISIGIGGLTILMLFVGHVLLSGVLNAISEIHRRKGVAKVVKAEHRAVLAAEKAFAATTAAILELEAKDRAHFETEIADDVQECISAALLPHEKALQDMLFDAPQGIEQELNTDEAGRVALAIEDIRTITHADIINAMSPTTTRKRK